MHTPTVIPRSTSSPDRARAEAEAAAPEPLVAVHTTNFPALLRQLGASLLVTTYQAGKLVMIRDEGDHLNTHFRAFQAPMGLAVDGGRLAVGTTIQVWEFVDVPAATSKLDPPGRHDACFLPRARHVTGNIQGHEMARGEVVTRGLSMLHSPRWYAGRRWPELANDEETLLENSFVVPDAALADVPAALRAPADAPAHAA
jgi:hypothetical protein